MRGVFLRSNLFQGSSNFNVCRHWVSASLWYRQFVPSTLENNEARRQAIRRHLEFFNTQPFVAAPSLGVTLALKTAC
ncbi:PTS system mannose/fructose/sorbose family transporter subunit IID [Shigella flexneri]